MIIFGRLVIANTIISYLIAAFSSFSISISKNINELHPNEMILSSWILLSVVSGLLWWIYLFYHWGSNKKIKSRLIKLVWFIILFFGTMLYLAGPIIYHILVIEMGCGMRESKDRIKETAV